MPLLLATTPTVAFGHEGTLICTPRAVRRRVNHTSRSGHMRGYHWHAAQIYLEPYTTRPRVVATRSAMGYLIVPVSLTTR